MQNSHRSRSQVRPRAVRFLTALSLTWIGIVSCVDECSYANAAETPVPLRGRQIAALRLKSGALIVGHVDAPSRVQLFIGGGGSWKPQAILVEPAVLVPGATLSLNTIDGEEIPQVLTIGVDGQFRQLTTRKIEGGFKTDMTSIMAGDFPAGGDFTTARQHHRSSLFAVDRQGQLWEFNPQTSKKWLIEGRTDLFLPGSNIQTLPEEGNEIFAIDRAGRLVSYVRDPVTTWKGPRLIGTDFVAGTDVAVWRRPDDRQELQVAAVNQAGELQVGRIESSGWRVQVAPGWLLPQGTPVSIGHTPVNMRFVAVPGGGKIFEMHFENTEWRERPVADGFAWKSNPQIFPQGPVMAGIDVAGNLVSGQMADEVWTCHVTTTDANVPTTKIAQRTWKRSYSNPFELSLVNTSGEELSVQLRDRLKPAATRSFQIAPASVIQVQIESDLGGEIEEARQSGAAPDIVTETKSIPTSPQARYDVEVLSRQARGVFYIDIRQKPWPQVPQRGAVPISRGQFTIPAGEGLRGVQIDLLKSIEMQHLMTIQP